MSKGTQPNRMSARLVGKQIEEVRQNSDATFEISFTDGASLFLTSLPIDGGIIEASLLDDSDLNPPRK